MGTLLFKMWHDTGDDDGGSGWVTLGELTPESQPGSVTDSAEGGSRRIIVFRCDGDRSVISCSAAGFDFEDGPDRVVIPAGGLEVLAELRDGQSHELDVTSESGREYRARWTHRD